MRDLPRGCFRNLKSEQSSDPEAKPSDGSGAGRIKGKLDFIFFLWAVLPDSKHCPGFLMRGIRETCPVADPEALEGSMSKGPLALWNVLGIIFHRGA